MTPVPATSSTSTGEGRPVRGARSCTLCRQMKSRCNATEMYPNPCSRCAHLGKEPCLIEPSFRRVNKRARIAEIQNELEQLKNTVKRTNSMVSRSSSDYSDTFNPFFPADSTPNSTFSPRPSPYTSPFLRPEDSCQSAGITGRIDAPTEDDLFLTFFTKFHPTLPIINNALTPRQAFHQCPLLYHTILLLASLATPNHPLTWALTQSVSNAAPQQVLSPNKSIHLVQAFLLLATWPQTQSQGNTVHDQAWMYVGVAVHMAQCIGLHRIFLSSEYTSNRTEINEDTRRELLRTWVGCFIVSQFLSSAIGLPPIMTEDFGIQNAPALLSHASSSYDPALSLLLDKLRMARFGARVSGLLSSCPNSSSGLAEVGDSLAIFRMLQGEIQEEEASLVNTDEARGLSFLWIKTQLYSYALHDGILPPSARAEFIRQGFEASSQFLETFSATLAVTPLSMLPALHPFSAVCCWMFVLKTLYSRYRLYLDVSTAEKTLMDTQKIMTAKSQSNEDFCWNAGIYMEKLLQDAKANGHRLGEPFLGTRSRMAAGLYYDGLARLTDITESHDPNANTNLEIKFLLATPPPPPLSSLASSPFLSSDDLPTPPTMLITLPEPITETPMFSCFWDDEQHVDPILMPEPKVEMEWLVDSFLTGEGGVTPSDLSTYVAPGLLMVQ